MAKVKTGKASYGGNRVKRKFWKLKDGEASYRILPPLGFNGNDPDGRWSVFHKVHYGYKNSKGEMRVFLSPLVKNRKTKMVEVPDAALERIEKLKAELEKAKAAKNQPVIDKLMELVGSKEAKYNLDSNHYMNAMDEHGNIGILKIRHRAKLALDEEIKKLREQGIDPLDLETGRFFTFRRSGTALDTVFQVTVKQKEFEVPGVGRVKQDIVHTVTDDVLDRLSSEAAELDKIYRALSAEEVARIVSTSDLMTGISSAVDEIFDTKKDEATANDDGADEYEEPDQDATQEQAAADTAKAEAEAAAKAQAEAAAKAQAEAQAKAAAEAAAKAKAAEATKAAKTSTTKSTAQAVSEQSDEEFLKSLGL